MQREMGRGELLDSTGGLIERGWARSEVRRYSRALAKPAQPERLKEWDYYCILTPDFGQVFGRFSGYVILDDGSRMEIRDLIGFAEEVRNNW
jgi:hypothetical protein